MEIMKKPLRLLAIYLLFSLIVLTASYLLLSNILVNQNSMYTFNQARLLTNGIMNEAENNYHNVSDFDLFAPRILSDIDEMNARLEIIDNWGRLVFDSQNELAYDSHIILDIKSQVHYDASFSTLEDDLVRFAFPLVVGGHQEASAVFTLPQHLVLNQSEFHMKALLLLPVFILLAAVFFAALILYRRVNRLYHLPIQRLNTAVNEISRGNLEGQINYLEDNELGKFCRSFDIMRLELKDSLERQSRYEKSRRELVTKISHDLRTPIASIKAYVEGLKKGVAKDPSMVDKYLSVIDKKTDSLVSLIDDLFQHSLQELGQLRINKQELYSKKFLEDILEPIIVQFYNSPVSFCIEGEIPDVLINVDESRIEQVIINLVQNANKYTSEGGNITFTAENQEEFIKISIKDTGFGVSQEDLPHIFDSFYRGQKFRNRDFEGSGLGLSICKYIIEQHGGSIWVDSRLNEGSTFCFTLLKV